MNHLLLTNDEIDAKSQAELIVVLAKLGVKHADLTQFERVIWASAYKLGYAQGALDANTEARDLLGAQS